MRNRILWGLCCDCLQPSPTLGSSNTAGTSFPCCAFIAFYWRPEPHNIRSLNNRGCCFSCLIFWRAGESHKEHCYLDILKLLKVQHLQLLWKICISNLHTVPSPMASQSAHCAFTLTKAGSHALPIALKYLVPSFTFNSCLGFARWSSAVLPLPHWLCVSHRRLIVVSLPLLRRSLRARQPADGRLLQRTSDKVLRLLVHPRCRSRLSSHGGVEPRPGEQLKHQGVDSDYQHVVHSYPPRWNRHGLESDYFCAVKVTTRML